MTPADEDFTHYVDCIDSLNRAWSILQDLGSVERPSARFVLQRSCSLLSNTRSHTLVPSAFTVAANWHRRSYRSCSRFTNRFSISEIRSSRILI